jgi:hypothetical protein
MSIFFFVFDHAGHNISGLGLLLGHLQSGGSLRRKRVLAGTVWVPLIGWEL